MDHFKFSQILDPISNLARTLREVSKPDADRMRRRARRLDFSADVDMAKYHRARYRWWANKCLDRARRKRMQAIQLRRDADRMDPKGTR